MTQAFNLSQFANKVNTSGQADLTTAVTGTLPVANGGTNQTTYTNGQLLIGNTTGNTLTKSTLTAGAGVTITNGAGAITIAAASGQIQTQLFTGPGTWTCPSSTTQVRVTVIGAGGSGMNTSSANVLGGSGGVAIAMVPVSAPVTVTVGAGGAFPGAGGTSSFGPAVSSTGGSSAGPANGAPGTGTVSVGTAIKTGAVATSPSQATFVSTSGSSNIGLITGTDSAPIVGTPITNVNLAKPYSSTSRGIAGAGGLSGTPAPVVQGGMGGAVVVEWVS